MAVVRCHSYGTFRAAWSALEESYGERTWLVVTDRNLVRAGAEPYRGLRRSRRRGVIELPGGERVKSLRRLDALARAAHEIRLGRDGLVIAVGGGTLGDLAGFFASIWMRGVDWVPVATTTLSIADSAVGGKTAVDWSGLKNQIGSFHDPVRVLAVEEALRTLPRRHYRAGLAEVVKSAVIADERLFAALEQEADELRAGRSGRLLEFLGQASAIKARIVARDPREQGVRAWLNFGHTVGHALESTHRPRLYHGEAVAAGMLLAARLSNRRGWIDASEVAGLTDWLAFQGLPVAPPGNMSPPIWLEHMARDKKVLDGRLRLILLEEIGRACVCDDVSEAELTALLEA
jgi:3-dehydroquinate synthase